MPSDIEPDTEIISAKIAEPKKGRGVTFSYAIGKPHCFATLNTYHRVAIVNGQPQLTEEAATVPATVQHHTSVLAEVRPAERRPEVVRWGIVPEHYWYAGTQSLLNGAITVVAGDGSMIAEGVLASITFPDGRIELTIRSAPAEDAGEEEPATADRVLTYLADCTHRRSNAPTGLLVLDVTLRHVKVCITIKTPDQSSASPSLE